MLNELTVIQTQGQMKLLAKAVDVSGVTLRTPLLLASITPKKRLLVPQNFPFRNVLIAILIQELLKRSAKLRAVSGVLQPLPMFPGASTQLMVHMATL